MMRDGSAMLTALALTAYATISVAASLPSGEKKDWLVYRVEVDDQIVKFTIPPGVNEEFLDPPVPQRIDLQQPGIFDPTGRGPRILSRHWDYRSNAVALVDGTLKAAIWIERSEKSLIDLDALQAAVSENQELSHAKDVMSGEYAGPPNPTTKFEARSVGGRQGFYVHYRTSLPDYVVTIDSHHYLVIYVSASSISQPDWREDAQAAADAILQSIRIEPRQ